MSYPLNQNPHSIHPSSKIFSNHSRASPDDEAEYTRLRSLAHDAHNKRNHCFEQSRAAYARGDGKAAHDLSQEGKKHDKIGADHHKQARDYIFRINNANRSADEIDLHGLYAEEAVEIVKNRIRSEWARGNRSGSLHVIVGKGNHSTNHVQKLKPAIVKLCQAMDVDCQEEQNAGRLSISLGKGLPGTWPGEQGSAPPPHPPPGQPAAGTEDGLVVSLVKKLLAKCCVVM